MYLIIFLTFNGNKRANDSYLQICPFKISSFQVGICEISSLKVVDRDLCVLIMKGVTN